MGAGKDFIILLVEDAKVMRTMEKKVLSSLGYENIIEAEDGNFAIDILSSQKIDLVISDWNMPNKDGLELVQWLRANDALKSLPFLMATGRGEKKEMAKAEQAGVNSFIAKPFNAAELKEKIDEALGLRGLLADIKKDRKYVTDAEGRVEMHIGHIQITDHLVIGVLKHLINKGEFKPKHFTLSTECMPSWNPIAKSLESHTVDGACILAPLAMDLRSANVPIKLVALAHKNGSIFVRNKTGSYKEPYNEFFKGKSFLLPHFMSIHHMLAHLFFTGIGLKPGMPGQEKGTDVGFEIVPPIQMPNMLASSSSTSGYLVAEPLGTKAIAGGIAEQQFLSSQLWEDHPCCIVVLQEEFITKFPDAVFEFVDLLVKSGQLIDTKPGLAAEIAVDFLDPDRKLGLKVPILKNVLTDPFGIRTNDLYPVAEDLEKMQQYMHKEMKIGSLININEFIDNRFAKKACKESSINKNSTFNIEIAKSKAQEILKKGSLADTDKEKKTLLNAEGKYLTFSLADQPFGIAILTVKEIIKLRYINELPNSPRFVKGIITLRNEVIPIVNLKCKLGFNVTEYDEKSVIIVLEVTNNRKKISAGILVDAVHNVTDISSENLEEPPKFSGYNNDYIIAMVKTEDKINMLIDIEQIIGSKDTHTIGQILEAS